MLRIVSEGRRFDTDILSDRDHELRVSLAVTPDEVRAAQRLRYQVFVEEMGADLGDPKTAIEQDDFDPYCQHLLVRDAVQNDRVIGCYRILTDVEAARAGGYYSQTEFDLSQILNLPGRFMEVGRACVHTDYRNGAAVSLLWQGLARFMIMHKFDYLMGCNSISLETGVDYVANLYSSLSKNYLSFPEQRVYPHLPLFNTPPDVTRSETQVAIPPLLKAYLRMGAVICGEPAWDPQFNVADLFVLLAVQRIHPRYVRHFVERMEGEAA
ncbi:MAG TPA: GNAT family N-acyltransferase [Gammaproteobacteria bacterium]|nr:GNAT family N-acyltransferase [Gammaproteobacteria bacterium]